MMWTTLISWGANLFLGKSSLFKWVATGVGAVAVVIFILWLLWSRAELKAENIHLVDHNAALVSANETNIQTINEMREAQAATEAALAKRDEEYKQINAKASEFRRRWQEAKRHDQTVRDWADNPVPDAVRGLFE